MTEEEIKVMQAENAKLKEGLAAMDSMKASIEALESKNREILNEKANAKAKADNAIAEAARKSGDIEALETSWKEKLATETTELGGKVDSYKAMIQKMTVGAEATKMANELALQGSADVLLPHIERRLSIDVADGNPIVRVLGSDGKPSAFSIDDLRKEISENKAFAPILVGSKASGSDNLGGKPSSPHGKTIVRSDFDMKSSSEQNSLIQSGVIPVDS